MAPAPSVQPGAMHEVDDELRDIKREIIESRGLVIKTNNLTNALSADIKSIAKRWVQDPNVTVIIRQINSRAVFITGRVAHAGRYPLNGTTSVLQLIAMAGGLSDWADAENVTVMRADQSGFVTKRFNYKDVIARKNLEQNIELQPGDTVIVP